MNKKNLVWIDLEMTGLDPLKDKIIEVAVLISDDNLNIIADSLSLVIHQSAQVLDNMNDWCKEHHGKSGLTKLVLESKLNEEQAEEIILNFLKKHMEEKTSPLCGNSIFQDRRFLAVHMPKLNDFLHYRCIDVSSIKELFYRWYPDLAEYKKKGTHQALEDIKESIAELKYYRQNIFK